MSTTTHRALPARHRGERRRLRSSSIAVPVLLGLSYGLYAAFLSSNNDESNTFITVVSLVGGAVVALITFLLGIFQSRMRREQRAIAYGTIFGVGVGYLLSLSGQDVLKAGFLGLFLGLSMGIVVLYVRYTHERT